MVNETVVDTRRLLLCVRRVTSRFELEPRAIFAAEMERIVDKFILSPWREIYILAFILSPCRLAVTSIRQHDLFVAVAPVTDASNNYVLFFFFILHAFRNFCEIIFIGPSTIVSLSFVSITVHKQPVIHPRGFV